MALAQVPTLEGIAVERGGVGEEGFDPKLAGWAPWTFQVSFGTRAGRELMASVNAWSDIVVWDVTTLPPTKVAERAFPFSSFVSMIEFSPDGLLAVGRESGLFELWDPFSFEPTQSFIGLESGARNFAFSADGTLLAAGASELPSQTTDTSLWDIASGEQIGGSFGVGDSRRMLSPDGSFLVVASLDEGVTLWNLDPDFWQDQTCLAAGRNLTRAEWAEFLPPDAPYRATCARWPVDPESVPDA